MDPRGWLAGGNRSSADFIFHEDFVYALFQETHTLFIGDSLMRGVYKDFVFQLAQVGLRDEFENLHLINKGLCPDSALKDRVESSFMGDRQIHMEAYKSDRVFAQAREWQTDDILMQYHFTTRIFKEDMDCLLGQFVRDDRYPDFLFISSCLWDISRYISFLQTDDDNAKNFRDRECQRDVLREYSQRLSCLFRRIRCAVPSYTTVTIVLQPHCIPQQEKFYTGQSMIGNCPGDDNKLVLRLLYTYVNSMAAQIARREGFSVVDLDFYMRPEQLSKHRVKDGIHWDPYGTRLMSQLIVSQMVNDHEIDLPPDIQKVAREFKFVIDRPEKDDKEMSGAKFVFEKYCATHTRVQFHNEEDDVSNTIPFYVTAQQAMSKYAFTNMEEDVQDAIRNDIAILRVMNMFVEGVPFANRDELNKFISLITYGPQMAQGFRGKVQLKHQVMTVEMPEQDSRSSRSRSRSLDRGRGYKRKRRSDRDSCGSDTDSSHSY